MLSSIKSRGELNSYPHRVLLCSLMAAGTKECLSLSARQGRERGAALLQTAREERGGWGGWGGGRGYAGPPAASSNKGSSLIATPKLRLHQSVQSPHIFVPLSLQTATTHQRASAPKTLGLPVEGVHINRPVQGLDLLHVHTWMFTGWSRHPEHQKSNTTSLILAVWSRKPIPLDHLRKIPIRLLYSPP